MSRAALARTAALWLLASLALRLSLWIATPDRVLPHAVGFEGDAPVWQQLALASARGESDLLFELPLRPPGMRWLVAMVWDGGPDGVVRMRLWFALLAACIPPVAWLLLRNGCGSFVAAIATGYCALATNLGWLGSGPHSESVYLLLALAAIWPLARLRRKARWPWWSSAGVLHSALCLLRPEHALVFALLLVLLYRTGAPRRPLLGCAAAFAVALLPWQLHAMAQVRAFANQPVELPAGTLHWTEGARERIRALPAPARLPGFWFVDATLRHRGADTVQARDVDVLAEAYGALPGPLPTPFVALYGGLNFFLGNSPEASGGFSPLALDRPPPLLSHPERYPRDWLANLPSGGQLALGYPPHLQALSRGYALGLDDIAADPMAWLARCAQKLHHFWQGAASGLGGLGLPIGLSGTRRSVDLVTADGALATAWRLLLLVLAGHGLWRGRHAFEVRCGLAFAIAKVATTLLFFGYARQGALLVPVVGLGLGLSLAGWIGPRTAAPFVRRLPAATAVLFALLETVRLLTATAPMVDGVPFAADASRPSQDFATRVVRF